jgi:hypothetical protein
MATPKIPTAPPVVRIIDFGAQVRKALGDEWHKRPTAYEFGNGRKFQDPEETGGPYANPAA